MSRSAEEKQISQGEQIRRRRGRFQAEAELIEAETEKIVSEEQIEVETEQIKAETEQIGTETEQIKAETEQIGTETEQIKAETEQIGAETEQIKARRTDCFVFGSQYNLIRRVSGGYNGGREARLRENWKLFGENRWTATRLLGHPFLVHSD
uniref:Uncharacterized protein n=1 Tax=Fagus sylvatica TaxID=28930 RepID=A0A2N9IME3_FAGSY